MSNEVTDDPLDQQQNQSESHISKDSNLLSPEPMKSEYIFAHRGYYTFREKRRCEDCNIEFEARITRFMLGKIEREFGGKYCSNCRLRRDKAEEDREKALDLSIAANNRRRWRETCGIPFHFMDKDFYTWDKTRVKPAYDLAVKFAEEFPVGTNARGYHSLLMYSKHPAFGVGKTHLAAAIAHKILDRHCCLEGVCPVQFTTETDIMLSVRTTYDRNYNGLSEGSILMTLKSRPLLILDDVGKEQPQDSKFMQRVYFHVIDGRYQRRAPMVITSNLDLEEIFDHIGGAAADRIFEMTAGNIVELKGKSYRRKEK